MSQSFKQHLAVQVNLNRQMYHHLKLNKNDFFNQCNYVNFTLCNFKPNTPILFIFLFFGGYNEWHRKTQTSQIKTTQGEIHQNRWHYGNRCSESAESQWLLIIKGERWGMFCWPHLGGTEATPILGTRWGKHTAICL